MSVAQLPSDVVPPSGGYSIVPEMREGKVVYEAWAPGGVGLGVFACPYEAAVAVWEHLLRKLDDEAARKAAIERIEFYKAKAAEQQSVADVDADEDIEPPSP